MTTQLVDRVLAEAGIAAAVYAAEALRRAGAPLAGAVEVSGTA